MDTRQKILVALEQELSNFLSKIEIFMKNETLLCRVTFQDGTFGFGQCGNKDVDLTREMLTRRVIPALYSTQSSKPISLSVNALGLLLNSGKPIEMSPIAIRVLQFELNYKMMGVQMSKAIAGIDGAIWDALGGKLKMPLYRLWNILYFEYQSVKPTLDSAQVYASSIARSISKENLSNAFIELRNKCGIHIFKMKVGNRMNGVEDKDDQYDFDSIRNEMKHVQSQLGKDCHIAVDANGAFYSAIKIADICSELNVLFLEEPVPWFRATMQRSLPESNHCKNLLRLSGGEQEFRMDVFYHSMKANVVDIVQPDFGYSGGPSHVLLICLKARELKSTTNNRILTVFPHSPQGDLHPIMALHMLLAQNDHKGLLELACVNDGLRQVHLNDKNEFRPEFSSAGGLKIENGRARLLLSDETNNKIGGWGIEFNQNWLDTCEKLSLAMGDDLNSSTRKRSFL